MKSKDKALHELTANYDVLSMDRSLYLIDISGGFGVGQYHLNLVEVKLNEYINGSIATTTGIVTTFLFAISVFKNTFAIK